ncbi:MAG: 50S ribosome-binding GTPase [Planctomycetes bacterium]|nr:50S ribosome-binding GTPase [Planctomycetota bacterium]
MRNAGSRREGADDTIVALASPPGGSERAVVRLSGARAFAVSRRLAPVPRRRGIYLLRIPGGGMFVPCQAWSMPAPRSYTREDVVEFHLPGCPPLVRRMVDRLISAGARPAEPGEFTRRAFVNGRLDLIQAEAVLAVIRASSDEEMRTAGLLLEGTFSRRLHEMEDRLLSLCADLEASIDFVDQDIDLLPTGEALRRVSDLRAESARLLAESRVMEFGWDAPTAFLVGPPNAGKSTLFNALVGGRSLTSDIPGTTRDLLEGRLGALKIVDAPGLFDRRAPTDLDRIAAQRAERAARQADLWIVVVDALAPERVAAAAAWTRSSVPVVTKADLVGWDEARRIASRLPLADPEIVSGTTGEGVDALRRRLAEWGKGGSAGSEARFALPRRQRALLREAVRSLDAAAGALRADRGVELAALDARAAMQALGALSGRQVDEDLLTRLFERFCIGK